MTDKQKVSAKDALKAIGMSLRTERKSNKKNAAQRCDQQPHQLKATFQNDAIPMETRVDAYHWYHVKANDGEVMASEDILTILEAFDG